MPTMRLSTRLLVLLLPTAMLVMGVYGYWALAERENTLIPETQQDTRAYATALALAFEHAFPDLEHADVQRLINQLSRDPRVYGIIVYGRDGASKYVSDPLTTPGLAPPDVLRRVLEQNVSASFERQIEDQRVFSVLRPVHGPKGRVTGALEVAQPLAFLEEEQARVRRSFLLNTLTLLTALTLATLWLVRRVVAQPLARLLDGVRALARGELAYRISADPGGGELAELGREFNAMAQHLEEARAEVLHHAEERVALARRLRETEKMAAIGNLAAGLAHEIAAPLNVISGRAEMLLRREADPEPRERSLQIIVAQIGRITTIVRNLLDFARRRELRVQPLDVVGVIDGVAEFLDTELQRRDIKLERSDQGPLVIQGDPDLLHQVFVNLFLNAVQAMEDLDGAGRIVIRGGHPNGDAPEADRNTVVIEVEDNGPGIRPDLLDRIFEPFFTTKSQGTGLGLVVARSIVEEHGGRLEAVNLVAGGARFRVTIPAIPIGTSPRA